MATLGHLAVGFALGRRYARPHPPFMQLCVTMLLFGGLALLPDLDLLGHYYGVPYQSPLGHRGAAHSLAAALLAALLFAAAARLAGDEFKRPFWFAFAAVASHGLLDAMTNGGYGVEFFWPFNEDRFFLPWRPIPVAPIGLRFFTARGLEILTLEAFYFSPLFLYALWPRGRLWKN